MTISSSAEYLMPRRRWETFGGAPRGIEAWEGVRRADHFAPTAMQEKPEADNPFTGKYYREFYHDPEFTFPMSEDCLYLNIWVPTENFAINCPGRTGIIFILPNYGTCSVLLGDAGGRWQRKTGN